MGCLTWGQTSWSRTMAAMAALGTVLTLSSLVGLTGCQQKPAQKEDPLQIQEARLELEAQDFMAKSVKFLTSDCNHGAFVDIIDPDAIGKTGFMDIMHQCRTMEDQFGPIVQIDSFKGGLDFHTDIGGIGANGEFNVVARFEKGVGNFHFKLYRTMNRWRIQAWEIRNLTEEPDYQKPPPEPAYRFKKMPWSGKPRPTEKPDEMLW